MQFTEKQQEAINHFQGPCLVLAVPGAGKTTVLLARLHMLIQRGVSPSKIASITFSRRQANDMKMRFKQEYGDSTGVTFSTIHAFCYQILLSAAKSRGETLHVLEGSKEYNRYQIVRTFARQLFQRVLSDEDLEDFFRIDGYLKNALVNYETYQHKTHARFPHFLELQRAYEQFKSNHRLIDFDDMLLKTLQLLDQNKPLRTAMQQRFSYYQVDEAQDTSLIQLRIIHLLTAPEHNLFFVADDDQSIYSFRGADPAYLLAFQKMFPGAPVLFMQDNYRSTKNIVALSAHLIRKNQARYEKIPTTSTQSLEKTQVILTPSLKKEMDRILKELPSDLERGTVAILFRNNISVLPLAELLDQHHIAFHSETETARFFHHPVVLDLLDFFQLALDPTDHEAFARVYYKLNQYLKREFMEQVISGDPRLSVWERLAHCEHAQNFFYQDRIAHLEHDFTQLRNASPSRAIDLLQYHIGYGDYLREHARRHAHSVRTDQRILEWLSYLAEPLRQLPQLEARLNHLEKVISLARAQQAPLSLSTIHGAKGLEYDTVWMIDLIQGEFPSTLSLEMEKEGHPEMLEEERRLFYVGMTRARTKLRLLGRTGINQESFSRSQFIDELIPERMKRPKK